MRQLWLFFRKYSIVFLFSLLEIIGFSLFFSQNQYQKSKFLNSTSSIQGSLAEQRNGVSSYFSLKKENQKLSVDNARLLEELQQLKAARKTEDSLFVDRISPSNFSIQEAEVITGNLNGGNNLFTISKGEKHGIFVGDGAIHEQGAIGKVVETTPNYSLVMPLFNRNMRLNVQHAKSGYNGDLVWSANSFKYVQVESISRTANVEIGDTIVTNQYSKSIPSFTVVGVVDQINYDVAGNFYRLDVTPTVDFSKLNYLHIVHRQDIEEIKALEEQE